MSTSPNAKRPKPEHDVTTASEDLVITPPTLTEAEEVVWRLPFEQGWNPGVEGTGKPGGYARFMPRPEQLLVGKINGKIECLITCPRYGNHGWLGLYIVRQKEMRGKGLGMKMWRAAMDGPLKGCVTVGLDGVEAQQANYRASGFIHTPWNVIWHTATAKQLLQSCTSSLQAHALADGAVDDLEMCVKYDAKIFPELHRAEFLRRWLGLMPESYTAIVKNSENGSLMGYGLIRPAAAGYRVGPLYADDEATAKAILKELARYVCQNAHTDTMEIHMVLPEAHCKFAVAELGMEAGFTCRRMYHGAPMKENVEYEFGVCSSELSF